MFLQQPLVGQIVNMLPFIFALLVGRINLLLQIVTSRLQPFAFGQELGLDYINSLSLFFIQVFNLKPQVGQRLLILQFLAILEEWLDPRLEVEREAGDDRWNIVEFVVVEAELVEYEGIDNDLILPFLN